MTGYAVLAAFLAIIAGRIGWEILFRRHMKQAALGRSSITAYARSHPYGSEAEMARAVLSGASGHAFRTVLGISAVYTVCRASDGGWEHLFSVRSRFPYPRLTTITFLLMMSTFDTEVKAAGIETGKGFFQVTLRGSQGGDLRFVLDEAAQAKLALLQTQAPAAPRA